MTSVNQEERRLKAFEELSEKGKTTCPTCCNQIIGIKKTPIKQRRVNFVEAYDQLCRRHGFYIYSSSRSQSVIDIEKEDLEKYGDFTEEIKSLRKRVR